MRWGCEHMEGQDAASQCSPAALCPGLLGRNYFSDSHLDDWTTSLVIAEVSRPDEVVIHEFYKHTTEVLKRTTCYSLLGLTCSAIFVFTKAIAVLFVKEYKNISGKPHSAFQRTMVRACEPSSISAHTQECKPCSIGTRTTIWESFTPLIHLEWVI